MKKMLISAILALTLGLSSCVTYRPISAGSGTIGTKKGTSTAVALFVGLLNFGDNSMLSAALESDIHNVATVDEKKISILGDLIVVRTTIVTGE